MVESQKKTSARRESEVEALLVASRAVLQYSSFEQSSRAIFDQAKAITGATSGYVALLSEDGAENEVLFLDAGGLECSVDPALPMPIRGLRSDAYKYNKAVYDNDFMNSDWVKFLPKGHVALRNVLFAPLVIEGRAVGLMGLANKKTAFNDDDARMAAAFGELASVALHNSQNMDQLRSTVDKLQKALAEVKALRGLLPICCVCKKIRDDKGYWQQIETYVKAHSDAEFTHGYCPECADNVRREIRENATKQK